MSNPKPPKNQVLMPEIEKRGRTRQKKSHDIEKELNGKL